jgi:EAL domain-containing protein (putative c-di-GMP-specific phosphodiesterase class I)
VNSDDVDGHGGSGCRRILLIDADQNAHADFRRILCPVRPSAAAPGQLRQAEAGNGNLMMAGLFQLDCTVQQQEGIELVRQAREQRRPYALAFVDVCTPSGEDVIDTVTRIWEQDPHVQIVICAVYSGAVWPKIRAQLAHRDQLVILKKPFESIEALQLADALTEKWRLASKERRRVRALEARIKTRARDAEAMRSIDAQLEAAGRGAVSPERGATETGAPRRVLAEELRRALSAGEFILHYQPLVEIASRRIVGVEALLRWQHPRHGLVPPGEFIPLAEESGLIVPIGEYVLRSACEQLVRWEREGIPVVRVAVNFSGVQLERQPVWALVRGVLRDTGLQPHRLAIEVTESTFMKDVHRHGKALQRLRSDGVHIEIDDFGTGYSSLSYLKQLPFDTLKIDRSFIRQLGRDSTDEAIVSAILALTRSLGLLAVAEGVETPLQLEVLGRHGCQVAQGFYFCRPLPAHQCRDLLRELAERTSFTDTLRLRIAPGAATRAAAPAEADASVLP